MGFSVDVLNDLIPLGLAGLIAGAIDAIAGGGGLINLPAIALSVGPGAEAIGTNKVPGALGALIALVVYSKKGHMQLSRSVGFTIAIIVGAYLGTKVGPLIPKAAFPWILLMTCPMILVLVWKKNLWVQQELKVHHRSRPRPGRFGFQFLRRTLELPVIFSGLAVGFYDGLWGPGGGTFMFLSLLFFARMPLMAALAAAKLANTSSAGIALLSYSLGGYVHWPQGLVVAFGTGLGAFFGAQYASKSAEKIVRPILLVVVILLLFRVIREFGAF